MENDKKGACCSLARKTSRHASIRSALAIETSYQVARQDLKTVKLDDSRARRARAVRNDQCRGVQSTADRHKSCPVNGTPAACHRASGRRSRWFSFGDPPFLADYS